MVPDGAGRPCSAMPAPNRRRTRPWYVTMMSGFVQQTRVTRSRASASRASPGGTTVPFLINSLEDQP
jgi:hypothetical protein